MKNIKKTIALGLAAMAAVSAMSMSAFASELMSTEYVDDCEVQYMDDCTIVKTTIEPSEMSYGMFSLLNDEERVWSDKTITQSAAYTRSFACGASDGNRLNVYINNTSSQNVNAVLTLPAGSRLNKTVRPSQEGVYGGYTFEISSSNDNTGISGTHTLKISNTDTYGNPYTVTTRARQFWN